MTHFFCMQIMEYVNFLSDRILKTSANGVFAQGGSAQQAVFIYSTLTGHVDKSSICCVAIVIVATTGKLVPSHNDHSSVWALSQGKSIWVLAKRP